MWDEHTFDVQKIMLVALVPRLPCVRRALSQCCRYFCRGQTVNPSFSFAVGKVPLCGHQVTKFPVCENFFYIKKSQPYDFL